MTRKIRTMHAKVRSVARPYEPALGERLLMASHFARQAQTLAAPRLKVSEDSSGATEIAPDHPDPRMGLSLLAEALATTDVSFVVGLISQLADAGTRSRKVDERELNFMLAVVKGAKPKDKMEAMLAAQIRKQNSHRCIIRNESFRCAGDIGRNGWHRRLLRLLRYR